MKTLSAALDSHPPRIALPSKPRFTLTGCFGESNAGDEALLAACLHVLRSRFPDARFLVFSNNPEETSRLYGVETLPNFALAHPRTLAYLFRKGLLGRMWTGLKDADCLVISGGEVLRTDFGLYAVLTFFDRVLLAARVLGKPVCMVGVGAGRLDPGLGLSVMRMGSRGASILTREGESAVALKRARIGLPEASSDLAFHLPPEPCPIALPPGPKLGFSLRDPLFTKSCAGIGAGRETLISEMARLADRAVALGITPVFVPFSTNPEDDDRSFHAAVLEKMAHSASAFSVTTVLAPGALKGLVGELDMMAGMRLHACVFALSASRPVIALSYDPKVRKQLSHFGLANWALGLDECSRAVPLLEALLNGQQEIRQRISRVLQSDRDEFQTQLDRILGPAVTVASGN